MKLPLQLFSPSSTPKIPDFQHFFSPLATTRNNLTCAAGCEFYPTHLPVIISQLGRRYLAGNAANHLLKVYRVSDQVVMASGTVLAASASDAYGYKWIAVTPFTLAVGVPYRIASDETNLGDTWMDATGAITNATPPLFDWAVTGSWFNAAQGAFPNSNTFGVGAQYVGLGMKQ